MKARWIAAPLMTLALVASSFAVAYAGGMGSGVSITLFNCYVILNGADSPYVLAVHDQFGIRQHVSLAKARLLCTQTTPGDFVDSQGNPIPNEGAVVERGPALNGNFDPSLADHLKCYDVFPPAQRAGAVVRITDPFGDETVTLERLSVLCSPATKTVLP